MADELLKFPYEHFSIAPLTGVQAEVLKDFDLPSEATINAAGTTITINSVAYTAQELKEQVEDFSDTIPVREIRYGGIANKTDRYRRGRSSFMGTITFNMTQDSSTAGSAASIMLRQPEGLWLLFAELNDWKFAAIVSFFTTSPAGDPDAWMYQVDVRSSGLQPVYWRPTA